MYVVPLANSSNLNNLELNLSTSEHASICNLTSYSDIASNESEVLHSEAEDLLMLNIQDNLSRTDRNSIRLHKLYHDRSSILKSFLKKQVFLELQRRNNTLKSCLSFWFSLCKKKIQPEVLEISNSTKNREQKGLFPIDFVNPIQNTHLFPKKFAWNTILMNRKGKTILNQYYDLMKSKEKSSDQSQKFNYNKNQENPYIFYQETGDQTTRYLLNNMNNDIINSEDKELLSIYEQCIDSGVATRIAHISYKGLTKLN